MKTPEKKSFWALMVVQFFGAFNDNLFKILVSLLIVEWVSEPTVRNQLVDLSGAIFVAPFLLFSMIAGRLSDRVSKSKVMRGVQYWQILVVAVASASLLGHSILWMMVALFLLSMQASFFSPAKYGVLPELMDETELSDANGLLNMATFAAILVGTIAGSFLSGNLKAASALLVGASFAALAMSYFIEPLPPAKSDEPWAFNPLADFIANWQIIRKDRTLRLGIIAVNYFWFMGAVLQLNIFLYAKEMMNASPQISGGLLIAVAIGIGLGSFGAGKLSKGKVELGLVPLGAIGMSVFAIDLMWAYHSLYRTMFDLFMLGLCGGFYEVPLASLVQWRSPRAERGRVLATVNFLSFVAILGASVVLYILGTLFHLNPAQVLFTLGVASLVATIIIYTFLPDAVWRLVLYAITNTIYRIRVEGAEHVPTKGPALLVCNHLSLADGFLVGGALARLVQFLIWRPYYDAKRFHWLVKTLKAIPISETDPPKEILRSLMEAREALKRGNLVCVFAEGQVSRTGNLLEFKRGFEVIVKGLDVPVVPVHLDRVWGSIFSFEHGKVLFKKPRRIPYPVTVSFGTPLRPPIQASQVRQAVLDLGAVAFRHRLDERKALPIEFLRRAKRHPRRLAVADSSGKKLSYGRLATVSGVASRALRRQLPEVLLGGCREGEPPASGSCVGILLPPSVGAVVANLAVSFMGRVPVNLNYTAGGDSIQKAVAAAGITRVLTSRKLLEKIGIPTTPGMVFVEDLVAGLSRRELLRERILFSLLPLSAMVNHWAPGADKPLIQTAVIIFSSGSTGTPKGVMLSHANILSNVLALTQVFDVGPKDVMVGILPFFHALGYTATFWFPLLGGFSAVYHVNPLDGQRVGELTKKFQATLLLTTPTFLQAYIRKCAPEQLDSLRFVVTGAERLRESIAVAFQEKFGVLPLEGYGCTELSPVATVNVPDISMGEITQTGHKAGKIGQPIPGVSVKIVDPENLAPLPQGEKGLLLVSGPGVMKGYLNAPDETRRVVRDGWYNTGDMAMIDSEGFVQIVDRLGRFSKIAGEMVPHALLEEKLHALAERTDPTFVVVSVADEKRGEALVVLYAGYTGSIEALLEKLRQSSLAKLWIPSRENIFEIAELPILGSGKLDMVRIKALAQEKVTARPQT